MLVVRGSNLICVVVLVRIMLIIAVGCWLLVGNLYSKCSKGQDSSVVVMRNIYTGMT